MKENKKELDKARKNADNLAKEKGSPILAYEMQADDIMIMIGPIGKTDRCRIYKKGDRPKEPGIYQWERTIVLVENGDVFNIIGHKHHLGDFEHRKFDSGWGPKLDIEC